MNAAPGQRLCRLDAIADGSARGFQLADRDADVFVVRQGREAFAYRNSCPHTGVALDWVPDQLLDDTGNYIQCANHGALFQIHDGRCIAGPCAGDALTKLPARVDGDFVILDLD